MSADDAPRRRWSDVPMTEPYEMWAWLETDTFGREGVIGEILPGFLLALPLQNRRRDVAERFRPYAEKHGRALGHAVRLVHLVEAPL